MKKIILASENKAKIMATQKVFLQTLLSFEVVPLEVDSDVAKTPMTDDEGIQGCLNRITNAKLKNDEGDVYVGLEGIITKNNFGTFICGWSVIEFVAEKKVGFGCSAKVRLPDFIGEKVESFSELSSLVKETYTSELIVKMSEIGTNGVVTANLYNRVDEFEDALRCALGYLNNPTNFK